MARTFRRHRSAHAIADLNVTNLIDLGFILLVIFMIATPLIQNEQTVPMNLPKVTQVPQQKPDKDEKFVVVGVDAKGRFFVGEQATVVALPELQSRLRAYAQEAKPPVMRLRGDLSIQYQKVAELIAELQKAGLSRMNFDFDSLE